MSGALLQLVAVGAQDKLFTSNPEITFFALKYRSYSNFALDSIDQTINGTAGFGRSVSCTISRNGDLINRVNVEVTLPEIAATSSVAYQKDFGTHLIEQADIEIGGQRIDKHYGAWLHIWNELAGSGSHKAGMDRMIGNHDKHLTPSVADADGNHCLAGGVITVPLRFWFCRHPGLALPLISLQYHEVKINITFAKLDDLITTSVADAGCVVPSNFDCKVWVDYVYLDNEERRRMAQQPHQYLIDQLQSTGKESIRGPTDKYSLNFNHPVKELVWTVNSPANALGVYSNAAGDGNPVAKAKLCLNGHDRGKMRDGTYYDSVQPWQHHTNTPAGHGCNVFSFALKAEEFQPSGTCNFSRIDNAVLEVHYDNYDTTPGGFWDGATLTVYAVNYNQLRIMSGMGGLTYSN